jgi:hypothetical protein
VAMQPASPEGDRVKGSRTRALPWTRQGTCPLEPAFYDIMEQLPPKRAFFPRYQCVILSRHRT